MACLGAPHFPLTPLLYIIAPETNGPACGRAQFLELHSQYKGGVMADFVKVAAVSEISPGDMKVVDVGEDQVLLVNVDGEVHACDDICSHAYASLSEGDLDGAEVQCPLHGAIFNVRTGKVLTPPAVDPLRIFEVRVEGEDIMVGPARES